MVRIYVDMARPQPRLQRHHNSLFLHGAVRAADDGLTWPLPCLLLPLFLLFLLMLGNRQPHLPRLENTPTHVRHAVVQTRRLSNALLSLLQVIPLRSTAGQMTLLLLHSWHT